MEDIRVIDKSCFSSGLKLIEGDRHNDMQIQYGVIASDKETVIKKIKCPQKRHKIKLGYEWRGGWKEIWKHTQYTRTHTLLLTSKP